MDSWDVIVVGAGACGLMAARELAQSGKKVCILEARDRVGGRIATLDERVWGYAAQLGAEFVHGEAPLTKRLIEQSGLTFIPFPIEERGERDPAYEIVAEKLRALKDDLPLRQFLERDLAGDEYRDLREHIIRRAEGYDAADADRVSTFAIRDEWLLEDEWRHVRIQEGYGALVDFLDKECQALGVEIALNQCVKRIRVAGDEATVAAENTTRKARQAIVTVPLPLIQAIQFEPLISKKLTAVERMGYGTVIKILLKFSQRFWPDQHFFFSGERIPTWWTQSNGLPVLTGWLAGPRAAQLKDSSDEEIISLALQSLSNIFKISSADLRAHVVMSFVGNWLSDPHARGAYSYATPDTKAARAELLHRIDSKLFFAGEALYSGKDMGTVESALGSGSEVARRIQELTAN